MLCQWRILCDIIHIIIYDRLQQFHRMHSCEEFQPNEFHMWPSYILLPPAALTSVRVIDDTETHIF
jgi:hypothetical protein